MPYKQRTNDKKGVCALRGYFGPPIPEPKTENCFSPISLDWFIRRITGVKFLHLFKFYRCYGNKNDQHKQRNCHFGPN